MPRSNSTEPSNAKSNGVAKGEEGNAIVEFVGVMGILVVPAVIALVVASAPLLGQSALTAAARDSARAFARSDTVAEAWVRAQSFADQALESRGIDSGSFPHHLLLGRSLPKPGRYGVCQGGGRYLCALSFTHPDVP